MELSLAARFLKHKLLLRMMFCPSLYFNLFGFNAPKVVGDPDSPVALGGRTEPVLRIRLMIWRTELVLPTFRNASLALIASRPRGRELLTRRSNVSSGLVLAN